MNEGQQGDVEVHLWVERRGARLAAGRGQARVQLPGGARHPGQQELLRLLNDQRLAWRELLSFAYQLALSASAVKKVFSTVLNTTGFSLRRVTGRARSTRRMNLTTLNVI